MENNSKFQVIVLGAGPAGCAAALKLKSSGCDVAIINIGKVSVYQAIESIDPSVKDLLKDLNFDQTCFHENHLPLYETISLWDGYQPIAKNSLFNAKGHGWILDKKIFNNQLQNTCTVKGVPIFQVRQLNIERQPIGGWKINATIALHPFVFSCAFLVDCTGRNRILLKKQAIPVVKHDSLIALNAIYNATVTEPSTASFIESAKNGWWYSAALPQGKRVVSFFTNAKSDSFKSATVYDHFHRELSGTKLLSTQMNHYAPDKETLHVRYANSEIATSLFGDDWICTGDAAATFDPLSSQGIGTALKAGLSAATAISNFIGSGKRTALDQFTIDYNIIYQQYLVERSRYYQQVSKWPESDFWQTNAKAVKSKIIQPVNNETKKTSELIG